jgi:hypothetical protein
MGDRNQEEPVYLLRTPRYDGPCLRLMPDSSADRNVLEGPLTRAH